MSCAARVSGWCQGRLEVVADGLPLVPRCTVGPGHHVGQPSQGRRWSKKAVRHHRRRKELRYPELTGEQGRARLIGV